MTTKLKKSKRRMIKKRKQSLKSKKKYRSRLKSSIKRKKTKSRRRRKLKLKKNDGLGDYIPSDNKYYKSTYDLITLEKCQYCIKLLSFLKNNNIKYNIIEIKKNDSKEEFKKQICKKIIFEKFGEKDKTFPIIVLNGNLVGGSDDMMKLFEIESI